MLRINLPVRQIIRPFLIPPPEVKQPHIISRFFLDQFADQSRHFYKYRRGLPPRWKSTKSECTEPQYFGKNNPRDAQDLENLLAQLENKASKIIRSLDAKGAQLSQDDTVFAALFIATLFQRSRKMRAQYIGPEVTQAFAHLRTDDFVRDRQHELLQRGALAGFNELKTQIDAEINKVLSDPAQLHFHNFSDRAAELGAGLGNKPWTLVRSDNPSFITSDSPVFPIYMRKGASPILGGPLLAPETAVFLALSPQTLLIMGPAQPNWNPVAEPDFIRDIRHATVSSADLAVYSTEKSSVLQTTVDAFLGSFHYKHSSRPPTHNLPS